MKFGFDIKICLYFKSWYIFVSKFKK